jgi:hypothetical protein
MKIEITYCKDGHSPLVQEAIDVKKFLIFEPAWLWIVRCMSDNEATEVAWECRENDVYTLLRTKIGIKGPGAVSVFPAVAWVDDEPEIVEWDKMNPIRSIAKDPFYVTVYNRTDLIEFSDLVLSKLVPVVLMVKVGGETKFIKKVMIEILNKAVKEFKNSLAR